MVEGVGVRGCGRIVDLFNLFSRISIFSNDLYSLNSSVFFYDCSFSMSSLSMNYLVLLSSPSNPAKESTYQSLLPDKWLARSSGLLDTLTWSN